MEREERKARRREELRRLKQDGQERRERERQEEGERRSWDADDIFALAARYAAGAFAVYCWVSGMGRMGELAFWLLGNNVLGWLVCGSVGLFLNVGLVMAIMRLKGRGLS
jgi:hypothetical protein